MQWRAAIDPILPDVNVLVYAHRRDSDNHSDYRRWLETILNAEEAYGISDLALSGFVRIVTHPRVFKKPSTLTEAIQFTSQLRSQPNYVPIVPGTGHWDIFTRLCRESGAKGNLIPDAYFVATSTSLDISVNAHLLYRLGKAPSGSGLNTPLGFGWKICSRKYSRLSLPAMSLGIIYKIPSALVGGCRESPLFTLSLRERVEARGRVKIKLCLFNGLRRLLILTFSRREKGLLMNILLRQPRRE